MDDDEPTATPPTDPGPPWPRQFEGSQRPPEPTRPFGDEWRAPDPTAPPPPGSPGLGYGYGSEYTPASLDKGARTSLILGVLSLVCCGLFFGSFAVYEGVKARTRIRESNGTLTGDGMALAGIILGVIGLVTAALLLILQFVFNVSVLPGTTTPQRPR